jgi:hypothetical protein
MADLGYIIYATQLAATDSPRLWWPPTSLQYNGELQTMDDGLTQRDDYASAVTHRM